MRFDLQHPNEYVRGNTLRFVCKLRDAELVEPLLQPARQCLEHRHAYVRKNAVFAIAAIYQHMEALIPDAPELIQNFLEEENDHTCKRNAFAALASISHEKAMEYLSGVFDGIPNADELLQLVELEFIRKDAVTNPQNKVDSLLRQPVLSYHTNPQQGPISASDFRSSRSQHRYRRLRGCVLPYGSDYKPSRGQGSSLKVHRASYQGIGQQCQAHRSREGGPAQAQE